MADPTLVISFGDEEFPLAGLKASEVMKVKSLTGLKNRREWFTAIADEDPEALLAALVIAKQRKGVVLRFADADFDFDDLNGKFVDEKGDEVEPVMETHEDGSLKKDADGNPIPVTDDKGAQQWRNVKSGEVLPFDRTA